jgi:hypothetical protein
VSRGADSPRRIIQALRTLAITPGHPEIDRVAISVIVGFPRHGILFLRCFQQSRPQEFGIATPKIQRREEDASSVTAARMVRIEAVVAELRDFDNCTRAAR